MHNKIFFTFWCLVISLFITITQVLAADTTPGIIIYEGKLLDTSENPIISGHNFRFSLWSSDDLVAGDIDGVGAINVGAAAYGGWQEVQMVTPNSDGTFSIELGSVNALPAINFTNHKFLQIEIKTDGAADISYQVMDPTGDDGVDTNDRQTIGSAPFTKNADMLDNAEIGTGSGDVATLGAGGMWNISQIAGGTNENAFVIDSDNSAPGDINLQFGAMLAKTLSYSQADSWFNFNDNVNIQGDLTITGTINGYNMEGSGSTASLNNAQSLTVSHVSRSDRLLQVTASRYVPGVTLDNINLDYDTADEANFLQEDAVNGTDFVSDEVTLHDSGAGSSTEDYPFTVAGNYTYDSNFISVSGGLATLQSVDQIDDDNTAAGFGGGTPNATQWDAGNTWMELTDPSVSATGDFSSRMIDAGGSVSWTEISWIPERPLLKELPDNAQSESLYTTGNANMTDNVVLMHLNENPANHDAAIADTSGQGNNGTLKTAEGVTDKSVDGIFNKAIDFDGIGGVDGDIVVGPSSNNITGDNLQTLTMSAWIKTASTAGQYVSSLKRSAANSTLFSLTCGNNGAGNLGFLGRNFADSTHVYLNHSGGYNDDEWHHVVGVVDGMSRTLYVDGVNVASDAVGMAMVTGNTAPFTAGGFAEGYSSLQFDGIIDEVTVWRRALLSTEIEDMYKRGALRMRLQVRSCDDAVCDTEQFIGPNGTTTDHYSELNNATTGLPSLTLTNVNNNRYFQYKAFFDTDDTNYSPELKSVTIGPAHYIAGDPTIVNNTGETYSAITSFTEILGGGNAGTVKYQISNNGTNWYYHNGANWIVASGYAETNTAVEINTNTATFTNDIGAGDLYFKTFLHSANGTEAVELDNVQVGVSTSSYTIGQSYYMATTDNSQLSTTSWNEINSITIDDTTPAGTTLKYLVSFDNRATWKYWDGGNWLTAIDTGLGENLGDAGAFTNANTDGELEALTPVNWESAGGFTPGTTATFDVVADFGTADSGLSSSLTQITVNFDEVGVWRVIDGQTDYPIDLISNTETRITNNSGGSETIKLYVR